MCTQAAIGGGAQDSLREDGSAQEVNRLKILINEGDVDNQTAKKMKGTKAKTELKENVERQEGKIRRGFGMGWGREAKKRERRNKKRGKKNGVHILATQQTPCIESHVTAQYETILNSTINYYIFNYKQRMKASGLVLSK